jgi:tripartite-type tricarboxylate transporter receptor subunit TctC
VAHPAFPPNNVKELIEYAKAKPGRINYGSSGNGTSVHLSMEVFKSMTKTFMVHIPYKGSAPVVTDLLAGQVDIMFDNLPNVIQHVRAGKMKALGVTTAKRSTLAPEVPSIDEAGVPGYDLSVWFGVLAPAGTPARSCSGSTSRSSGSCSRPR